MFGHSKLSRLKNILALTVGAILCSPIVVLADDEQKMVFAVDVIRHGDRSPIIDFPSAPYNWPQGLGQLTPEGMNQEFLLGKEFRHRYIEKNHLLPDTYDKDAIYVRASDIDRTLMSAECALLGLYPLGKGPLTESGAEATASRYQPIPIHTRPRETDDVLIPDANKTLPQVYKKYVVESSEWKAKLAEEQPHFEKWGKIIGKPITDLQQLSLIGDSFYIRKLHHVPLPEGATESDADDMDKVGDWVFTQNFKPPEVGQVGGINLLRLIVKYLDEATNDGSKLKYVLCSAHDSTIAALLSAVKAPATHRPRYSSDLNITLWKSGSSYKVQMTLNGDPVNFPGAVDGTSSLDKFAELLPH